MAVELPPGSVPGGAAVTSALALASGLAESDVERTVDATGAAWELDWTFMPLPRRVQAVQEPAVAVVTGGLGGLGLGVAETLSRDFGWHPVLLDSLDPEDLVPDEQQRLLALLGQPAGATVCTTAGRDVAPPVPGGAVVAGGGCPHDPPPGGRDTGTQARYDAESPSVPGWGRSSTCCPCLQVLIASCSWRAARPVPMVPMRFSTRWLEGSGRKLHHMPSLLADAVRQRAVEQVR